MTATIIRDRCIRCRDRIRVAADMPPTITVMTADRTLRGFHCRLCKEHLQHVSASERTLHVERWP